MEWAYGVTTVPQRRDTYLPGTLRSLALGGFDKPRIFVDGDSDPLGWERKFPGLPITARWPAVKVVGSWVLGMIELYVREPEADRYVIFQDDVITGRNVRTYLDRLPAPERGYFNLITYPNGVEKKTWDSAPDGSWVVTRQKHRGAHGIVLTCEGVRALFSTGMFFDYPREVDGWKGLDRKIGLAMNAAGWTEYVHKPSILLTTGDVSTIRHPKQAVARSFPGDMFDFLTLVRRGPGINEITGG